MPAQSPYKLYCKYVSVKLHLYTENYDILKYNRKTNISEETFNKRKDKFIFYKLANLIDYRDSLQFFVSQLMYRDGITPASIVDNFSMAEKVFERWRKNISFLYENYNDDIAYIARNVDYDWKNCFITDEYDYPVLFKMVMGQKIHMETYSLLYDLFSFDFPLLKEDMIYQGMNLKFRKYRSLLNVDSKELAKITPKNLLTFKTDCDIH